MKTEFLSVLNDWYGSSLQRYEIIKETEQDVLLFTAFRNSQKILTFEIVRVFMIGNSVQISVDESVENGLDMDKILKLINTVVRVL